jgi:hypothetical protein
MADNIRAVIDCSDATGHFADVWLMTAAIVSVGVVLFTFGFCEKAPSGR